MLWLVCLLFSVFINESRLSKRLGSIEGIPPSGVVLQPLGKPGEDGVLPTDALAVIQDVVVLTVDQHHGGLAAKELEGGIHLDALSYGHVVVHIAMQEEQRGVNLVGIVERAVLHKKLLLTPGVAVGHGDFAIGIPPVAFTPIAGVVADAGVRDSSGKEVGLGLQVLRHEATV